MRGHYFRLYTQQFRHELEVQYGVADDGQTSEVLKTSEVFLYPLFTCSRNCFICTETG
jgi:hypothetical protein